MSIAETVLEKVSALPPEKQKEALRFIESLEAPKGEPGCALQSVANLKVEGPSDVSERFHETLYGVHVRDER